MLPNTDNYDSSSLASFWDTQTPEESVLLSKILNKTEMDESEENEEQDNKEEDNGIEMSENFDSNLQDKKQDDNKENDEEDEDKSNELDDEKGDVDDHDDLDKDMWGDKESEERMESEELEEGPFFAPKRRNLVLQIFIAMKETLYIIFSSINKKTSTTSGTACFNEVCFSF